MTPTASEIIDRVKARYAGCRSYEDTGTVTKLWIDVDHSSDRSSETTRFRSAFERPNRLLFSFTDESERPGAPFATGGVLQDARGARSWFGGKAEPVEPVSSVELELASRCTLADSSTNIPFKLLGLMPRLPLERLAAASGVERTSLEGVRMLVLHDPGGSKRMWIEEDSLLVVRLDSISHTTPADDARAMASFREMLARPDLAARQRWVIEGAMRMPARYSRIETTTVWHPRMDHDIDPQVFEFVPPG